MQVMVPRARTPTLAEDRPVPPAPDAFTMLRGLAKQALVHGEEKSAAETHPHPRRRKPRLPKSVNIPTALDMKAPRGDPFMLSIQEIRAIEQDKAKIQRRRERAARDDHRLSLGSEEEERVEGKNGYWVEFMGVRHWMSEVDPEVLKERKERERLARLELRGVNVKKQKVYPTLWREDSWRRPKIMCKTSTVRVRRCAETKAAPLIV